MQNRNNNSSLNKIHMDTFLDSKIQVHPTEPTTKYMLL